MSQPAVRLNAVVPNFTAETTKGEITLYDYIGDGYVVLFSHPKDFTPVCTTEIATAAKRVGEFAERNTKLLVLSIDSVEEHHKWVPDVEKYAGVPVSFPLIGDPELKLAKLYGMLDEADGDSSQGRSGKDNQTARVVFIIGPDHKLKASITYPATTGRNFDEILRVLDSIQLTAKSQVATPSGWNKGGDVVILPSVNEEAAKAKYPDGWETPLPYIRLVPDGFAKKE